MDTFYVNQPWNSRLNTKLSRMTRRRPPLLGKDANPT